MKKRIAVVLGTRPEIIKLFPVIIELKKWAKVEVIHTGQHYSSKLNQNNLDIFKLKIDHQIVSKTKSSFLQFGKMTDGLNYILAGRKYDLVLVHGDTNSTLAGALCASRNKIPIAHIEAGARCHDKTVPEEQNRIIVDHLSWLNFAYDVESKKNLANEGINKNVFLFSNTIYSAISIAERRHSIKKSIIQESYIVCTIHREENTSSLEKFNLIVDKLNSLSEKYLILFPVHPRTRKILNSSKKLSSRIKLTPPLDYLSFLNLLKNSSFAISDSGGLVDECVYFNKPLIIIRNSTERNYLLKQKKIILIPTNRLLEENLDYAIKRKYSNKIVDFDIQADFKISKTIKNLLK